MGLTPALTFKELAMHTARSLLKVYVILGVVLWIIQDLMLFPGITRPEFNDPPPPGYQEVMIEGDEADVRVIHSGVHHDRVVVMTHGNGDFAAYMVPYGQLYGEYGWDWVCVEYRRYDGVGGWPSEAGLAEDLRTVLDWLPSQGWSLDRTIVHGLSIGGGVAVAGAHDAPVAGFVFESTFDSVVNIAQRRFPTMFFPVRLLVSNSFDNTRLGERDVPVFQVHDRTDPVIPFVRAQALRDQLQDVTWMETEGHPHGTPLIWVVSEVREAWQQWFEKVVPAR